MPAEAILYQKNIPAFLYGGNVDAVCLKCLYCEEEYHIHYSNSERGRLPDCRTLAADRINAEHPDHERSILL